MCVCVVARSVLFNHNFLFVLFRTQSMKMFDFMSNFYLEQSASDSVDLKDPATN